MLAPMTDLLALAAGHRCAVGSFEVPNLEAASGVLDAAREQEAPVILAIAEEFLAFQPLAPFVAALRAMAHAHPQPVAILLDHARHIDRVVLGIQAGVNAIMFDASHLGLEENIEATARVVALCHAAGIGVEGEVGAIPEGARYDTADGAAHLTRPDDAVHFVRETGVDALAVAVGTAHGQYRGTPSIDHALIATIAGAVRCPLVLHGGSGTGEERLRTAIAQGIRKVNVFTDASVAAYRACQHEMEDVAAPERIDRLIRATRSAFRETARHYNDVFGAAHIQEALIFTR